MSECRAVVDTGPEYAHHRTRRSVRRPPAPSGRRALCSSASNVGNQFLVVREERRLRVEFRRHQRLANEYLA